MRTVSLIALLICAAVFQVSADDKLTLHKRARAEQPDGTWLITRATESWSPQQTAIIVCDMWDAHHCLNAVRRETEMAPQLDKVLKTARKQGVLIIHAPSSCMEPYENHPGRKLAKSAPKAKNLPAQI